MEVGTFLLFIYPGVCYVSVSNMYGSHKLWPRIVLWLYDTCQLWRIVHRLPPHHSHTAPWWGRPPLRRQSGGCHSCPSGRRHHPQMGSGPVGPHCCNRTTLVRPQITSATRCLRVSVTHGQVNSASGTCEWTANKRGTVQRVCCSAELENLTCFSKNRNWHI